MATVSRHVVDVDRVGRQLEVLTGQLDFYIDYLTKDTSALHSVLQRSLTLARYRSIIDACADEPETGRMLRLAAQAAVAVFAVAEVDEGEVDADVGGPVRLQATGPASEANAGAWLRAAMLAVIVRDDDMIRRLCGVSLDTLRASGGRHDAYMYPWVESLQTFLRKERVPPDMFIPVMDGTDPDKARITPPAAMLRLVYPPIKMFYFVLRRDAERFNESLEQALTFHRDYWTADGRADDPDGFIALQPLGVAVLARAVGIPIKVESSYLPTGFLTGTSAPEQSTYRVVPGFDSS